MSDYPASGNTGPVAEPSGPEVITLTYGMVMLYLNWEKKVDGPYPFFRVHNQSAAATILWIAVLFALVSGISAGVWILAR